MLILSCEAESCEKRRHPLVCAKISLGFLRKWRFAAISKPSQIDKSIDSVVRHINDA